MVLFSTVGKATRAEQRRGLEDCPRLARYHSKNHHHHYHSSSVIVKMLSVNITYWSFGSRAPDFFQ